jgi:hypothetical protein
MTAEQVLRVRLQNGHQDNMINSQVFLYDESLPPRSLKGAAII